MLRTLQLTLKWPSSLDSLVDFSPWTSRRHSVNFNWLFQSFKLLRGSGLQFDFPDHAFLDLMPNEACPLVSISSNLATLETHSKMGLIVNTGKTPSWFQIITSIPNLTSLLPQQVDVSTITPALSSLVGKFVNKIDTSSLDDNSGNRLVYFSHWIPATHDRMQITPCSGYSLHCLADNEGPLALKSVTRRKLLHKSCLSILPSYRCLQLFQMTAHIDISQQIINLKLSSFLLCSYFRFLLEFSELYIPERFSLLNIHPLKQDDRSSTPSSDPIVVPLPAFALRSETTFHISGIVYTDTSPSTYLICAWVQTIDDFILDSGIFSCPILSPFNDVAELAFVTYVLNSIPVYSSVTFVSSYQFANLFSHWCNAFSIRRTRLKNNSLWSCISELLKFRSISCYFHSFSKHSAPSHSVQAQEFIKECGWFESLHPVLLIDAIFPTTLN
ncbi:unnamed protein product [Rhizophagus irregularis]|nr:unnamed protein product [Rhizophagus irregularis]